MKIILSRKGFDSTYGGKPSPIYNGQFISFPVPEKGSGIKYSDLKFVDGSSYYKIMEDLGIEKVKLKKESINIEQAEAHLDPDLRESIFFGERPAGWVPIFGQDKAAQGHLDKHNITVGDLFLFFGTFREVVKKENKFMYHGATELHAIFGYFQVGRIIKLDNEPSKIEKWMCYHPHVKFRGEKSYSNNTLYVACDRLTFDRDKKGAGVLKCNDRLVLTKAGRTKSVWELESFFHPNNCCKISYNANKERWTDVNNGKTILESASIGQEFVINGENNKEIEKWAEGLIKNCETYE